MYRPVHPRIAELRRALSELRRAELRVQTAIAHHVARYGDVAELEELRAERDRVRAAVEDAVLTLGVLEDAVPADGPVRGGVLLCR